MIILKRYNIKTYKHKHYELTIGPHIKNQNIWMSIYIKYFFKSFGYNKESKISLHVYETYLL